MTPFASSLPTYPRDQTVAVIGLESSGKSALFRTLTDRATGDEANFRGSTVRCRRARIADSSVDLVDTPGIRVKGDTETTRLALGQLNAADAVVLVVRGTHVQSELAMVLSNLAQALRGRKVALAVTFADKAPAQIKELLDFYQSELGIPVTALDARHASPGKRNELVQLIADTRPLKNQYSLASAPQIPIVHPKRTVYEHRYFGPIAALASIVLLFGIPVGASYCLSQWLQPIIDANLIAGAVNLLASKIDPSGLTNALLIGDYGVITLGWYSFLWAFPVVISISASVAITEETGLKDRITASLDPLLRIIGLSGRDLIPVLTGFGCNVVAIFQSRSCSLCNRKNCVSMIAFGSACSYQIGASLSLFSSGHRPWLFLPYLFSLFLAGAIHTKVWGGAVSASESNPISERAFLQKPTLLAMWWRVRATLRQFLFQAMPVFLAICVAGAFLTYFGVMDFIGSTLGKLIGILNLPSAVAPGIVLSIIRKDGLLVLNKSGGTLLHSLDSGQLFLLVFLASTLTACLVTLLTIWKELGFRFACILAARQSLTSIIAAIAISIFWRGITPS